MLSLPVCQLPEIVFVCAWCVRNEHTTLLCNPRGGEYLRPLFLPSPKKAFPPEGAAVRWNKVFPHSHFTAPLERVAYKVLSRLPNKLFSLSLLCAVWGHAATLDLRILQLPRRACCFIVSLGDIKVL
eukprot:Hpha_TRINITY_DN10112_c0_g2::TRINITY_DN10112_c0_g2_i1::g.131670::m.131670